MAGHLAARGCLFLGVAAALKMGGIGPCAVRIETRGTKSIKFNGHYAPQTSRADSFRHQLNPLCAPTVEARSFFVKNGKRPVRICEKMRQ
jgi:hypothetical protein